MGNKQSLQTHPYSQKQFITQAHVDWMHQMQNLFLEKPTMTKTVILPPGVHLDDKRINEGVVVAERKYSLPLGNYPEWPETVPFECDVDRLLLPPCQGQEHMETHYAVYPNEYFPEVSCAYCNSTVDLCKKKSQGKKLSLPSDKDASLPSDKDASLQGDKDASLPGDKDASLPGDKDASLPGDKDASLPGDKDASLPSNKDASLPGDKVASLSRDKDASFHDEKQNTDFLHNTGSVHSKTLTESNQLGSNNLEPDKPTEIASST